MALLEITDLVTAVESEGRLLPVVDGLSLSIDEGETVGLVGESGCGKSMTAVSIMQLLPHPSAFIQSGSIRFDGSELVGQSRQALARLRGEKIAMIFQDPMTALNPVHRIGKQISEMLALHDPSRRKPAALQTRVLELLQEVGIPDPKERFKAYPHQLSGGMRQRVMIAMALACRPKLLIADEPTTALDVTIQAQIIELIRKLQREYNMAMLFITHDLGLVAQTCSRVAVMYAGEIVEESAVKTLFRHARHPYTQALIKALPAAADERKMRLQALPGQVPAPGDMPPGCRFANRCAHARDHCRQQRPRLEIDTDGHKVACLRWRELTA